MKRTCKKQDCKDKNGNCLIPAPDDLPVQCVGPWVDDKYYFLEKYLNATCEARRMFTDKNNAVFIDLFAGPGKCIIRDDQRIIDNGGMRALGREEAPFNEYFFFDIVEDNVNALKKRVDKKQNCHIRCGDSNVLVKDLVEELLKSYYKYHVAFIDPFGPDGLKFNTLRELAKLKRMDMLIHFPIGAIKRNLKTWLKSDDINILDDFLGTSKWRQAIQGISFSNAEKILIDIYKEQLISIGYPENGLMDFSDENIAGLSTVPVRNRKDVDLYVLVLASKHELAQKIWNSIIKIDSHGQKSFL